MAVATLTVAVPLIVAAGLLALRPLSPRRLADAASIATAAAVCVLSAIVLARASGDTLVYWLGGWRPNHGVALGISLTIDPIGAATALFTGLLALGATVFATRYIEVADDLFHVLMLVFLAGMVGFALAGDLFTLFVFFELLSVAAFVLAGYQIEQRAPLEGSLNFAITGAIGSFLLLLGIGLAYGRTGALNLAQIGEALAGRPADALVAVSFALIVSGFLVKAAIVPFHFWLADAYAVARTPVCIMFAGVMSELGLYGVARVWWSSFSGALGAGAADLRAILVAAGVLTALLGAGMALAQTHLKRLLAFVTIAYLGLFLVGVGLLNADGLAGAALFVAGDGFLKGALFVCVGIVQHRRRHVDEVVLHGQARDLPFTGALFALSALAVASLPPFGSFLGKSLIEHGASKAGYDWLVPVFIAVSIASGAAVLRAAGRVFAGAGPHPRREPMAAQAGDEAGEEEAGHEPDHTPAAMFLPALALFGAALAVGVIPGLGDHAVAAAHRFLDRGSYVSEVLGAGGGHSIAPSGGGVEWYDWLYGAVSAAGALGLAALLLAGERVGGRVPLGGLRPAFAGVRALHSGHPGDYVAFLVAGTAVLGGLFALTLV